jgi:high-affinity K+ transport system ATPase subunit B
MNVVEGARRMKSAGRWMLFVPLTLLVLLVGVVLIVAYLPIHENLPSIGLLDLVFLLIPIASIGAFLWLAGWILEGYAQGTH